MQLLSAAARGAMVELLMRLGGGMPSCLSSELMASLYLDEAELQKLCDELVRAKIVTIKGGVVTLLPEMTRLLLMGAVGEVGRK